MAFSSSSSPSSFILFLVSSLLLHAAFGMYIQDIFLKLVFLFVPLIGWLIRLLIWALGEIICEELPNDKCAFSIASSGKRCLLEKYARENGEMEYQCRTSEVIVERMSEYIETDQCVSACGVDRSSVGISSDSLLEPQFTAKLCSSNCYHNCPNIIDLYFNLAAGEGNTSYSPCPFL